MYMETPRLILRNLQESDLNAYLEFHNSDFVLRYNCMQPETEEQAQKWIENNRENDGFIAVTEKQTGALMGIIYVHEDSLRYQANSKEVAYWLGEPYSGKGYMTEALGAVVHHLVETEGKDSITARAFGDNPGSPALLRKLGFCQEGHLHRAVRGYDGRLHDDLLFSWHKEEA